MVYSLWLHMTQLPYYNKTFVNKMASVSLHQTLSGHTFTASFQLMPLGIFQ